MVSAAEATPAECRKAAARRVAAARKYRPKKIRLLVVAEMPPPTDLDRYFYFEYVPAADYLFQGVIPHFLAETPSRFDKGPQLARLRELGVFVVDLKPNPCAPGEPEDYVADLVKRVTKLVPEQAILIKANVYDSSVSALTAAGVKVIPERIYFPSQSRQPHFKKGFRRALKRAGWTSLAK